MSGTLYVITGASGSGKTTLLNSICTDPPDPQLRIVKAPKWSERQRRDDDDDIIHDPQIELGEYDIAYFMNGWKYGIKTRKIAELLEGGMNASIILSDFRVIRRVKDRFGEQAKAVYISSAITPEKLQKVLEERHLSASDPERLSRFSRQFARLGSATRLALWKRVFQCMGELLQDWKEFIPEGDSAAVRSERISELHTRYVDNLELFDHVVLNYTEDMPSEMADQMRSIIGSSPRFSRWKGQKAYPPIFVVAAASGAGKGTLMEMLNLIGRDQIAITSKMAKRVPKLHDKRDGMIAIGGDGDFPSEYDLRWSFHQPSDPRQKEAFQGIQYAVSSAEIERNVASGMPQIFVSNMGQFDGFRQRFGNHVVFLYLHRLSSAEERREFQYEVCETTAEAEARIGEIDQVHKEYIRRVAEFDHVLLNTTHDEDLYDQMFQLVECYGGSHRRTASASHS